MKRLFLNIMLGLEGIFSNVEFNTDIDLKQQKQGQAESTE